jgi:hypothetical protein
MNMTTVIRSALCLALLSLQAGASEITFNTLPTTFENNTYNGFLGATIDGVFANIVCDDFTPTTYVPSGPWTYNLSTLPSLAFARFGNDAVALSKYKEAAVLLGGDGGALAGLENVADPDIISSYQYALWVLFTPSAGNFGDSASLLNTAGVDVAGGTVYSAYADLQVYTPSESAASNQEFLGMGGGSTHGNLSLPEPGTSILMGLGLLVSSLMGRKFVRSKR